MTRSPELSSGNYDADIREGIRRAVDGLQLIPPGQPVQETQERDNTLLLAPDAHGGARIIRDNTQVIGMAGAVLNRLVIVDTAAAEVVTFEGVTFTSEGRGGRNNQATLLDVRATARLLVRGCTFIKHVNDLGDFVTIAAGGRVRFIGCLFLRGTSATNCVNNAGVAADVQAVACARMTPAAHVAVTLVAGEVLP